MSAPNKRQSKILHQALVDIAKEIENNSDVEFVNDMVDFINNHQKVGQGCLGHYGQLIN
jgi:hypothetical protein